MSGRVIRGGALSVLVLLFATGACAGEAAPAEGGAPAKAAGKVVFAEDFEKYDETEKWDGGGAWQVRIEEGANFQAAVGKAFGREGGKGMLLRNTQVEAEGRLKWGGVSRQLAEVVGQPVFTLTFHYLCPSTKPPDSGRIDLNMTEPGAHLLFIMFGPGNVTFIYKDTEDKKTLYAGAPAKVGEWHKVQLEIDHNQNKFRVLVDGQPVKGDWGEWANFRYDKTASADKVKTITFHAADRWPSSVRYVDDITLSLPEAAKAE